MMTDLVEQHTAQDGHIDGEEDIAAIAAITYAGRSYYPYNIFHLDVPNLSIFILGGSDTVSCSFLSPYRNY